jgi:hypothetical protein
MKNTKHTPGPWFNEGTKVFTKQLAYYVAETQIEGKSYTKQGNEAEANARLIGAAPELLEALEAVFQARAPSFNFDFSSAPDMQKVADAIRKAKGE